MTLIERLHEAAKGNPDPDIRREAAYAIERHIAALAAKDAEVQYGSRRYEEVAAKLTSAESENAKLRDALTKLSNEVFGSLSLMETPARREFGNTNYAILIQRAEEARAALMQTAGEGLIT